MSARLERALERTYTEAVITIADQSAAWENVARTLVECNRENLITSDRHRENAHKATRSLLAARDIAVALPHGNRCRPGQCVCSVSDLRVALGLACTHCYQGLHEDDGLMCPRREGALTHHNCDNGCPECGRLRKDAAA